MSGFDILSECGRGGAKVVYLAEQVGLGRRVALKVLKPELVVSAEQRARFEAEAKALARLQHPNFVQLYDAGSADGRTFFVEEYVAGGSLAQDFARQPRAARPAAALVATLARAVHHAHRQGIVHRDLKPANVLLTSDGVPKISDFGLAKQGDPGAGPGLTETGLVLGSPSYMAPEQAAGRPDRIGPSVDIYALGAILYEATTGRPPFLAASPLETLDQVRSIDPVPPRHLQPGLPRDLETICLKCLAKDPARRYPTAEALAEDLDRFLVGRTILARPASAAERLARWVRRHPATAASSSVAGLAVVAMLGGAVVYQSLLLSALRRAEASAEQARIQQRRADARYRAAGEALNRMVAHLDDRRFARLPRLKELLRLQLEDVLAFYGQIAGDLNDPDPGARFDLAQATLKAGLIHRQLGRLSDVVADYRTAVGLLEPLVREVPGHPDYRFALAQGYRGLAVDSPDAERHLREALRLLEPLVRVAPDRPDYRTELALSWNNLGFVRQKAGDRAGAADDFRRANEALGPLLGPSPSPADVRTRVALAENHRNLAVLLQGTDPVAAVTHYTQSRRLLGEVLAVEPDRDEAALALGGTIFNWAIFAAADPPSRGQAEGLFDEAIDRLRPILEREPGWDRVRVELLSAHGGRAQFLESEGRHAEAARDWERVVTLADPGPQQEHFRFFLATSLARAGEHRKAWEVIQSLEGCLNSRAPEYTRHLATVCALAVGAAGQDPSLSEVEQERLTEEYGRAGLGLVRRFLTKGPTHERAARLAELVEDAGLAALRRRPDWAESTAAPVNPGAGPAPADSK